MSDLPKQVPWIKGATIHWEHEFQATVDEPNWGATLVLEVTMDEGHTTERLLETLTARGFSMREWLVLDETQARAAKVISEPSR